MCCIANIHYIYIYKDPRLEKNLDAVHWHTVMFIWVWILILFVILSIIFMDGVKHRANLRALEPLLLIPHVGHEITGGNELVKTLQSMQWETSPEEAVELHLDQLLFFFCHVFFAQLCF